MTPTVSPTVLPAALLAALALGGARAASDIEWSADREAAFEEARGQDRVVFLAVNMDGERANDELAEETYHAQAIVGLSQLTTNLVASAFEHTDGECSRFEGIPCSAHLRCDVWARENVLAKDAEGYVIAPQHVWFAPSGEVLLSVPYALSEGELEWCWARALEKHDPEIELRLSDEARAPRRLVEGGVADPGQVAGGALTRDQALELIDQVKRGMNQRQRALAVRRIMTVDEPEAIDFVRTEMRSGGPARGGGRRGGGGGGAAARSRDLRPSHLRNMGTVSPQSYWEIAVEYVDDSLVEIRVEAAVALEMLGAPDSLRDVKRAMKREREPSVKKNLLRAIGTAGATDDGARKLLLRTAEKDSDESMRRNALLALGSVAPHEDVDEFLREVFADEEREPHERSAAICAMALTRRPEWLEWLQPALEAARAEADAERPEGEPEGFVPPPETLAALEAAVAVLEGAELSVLRNPVASAGRDEIPRQRWFGIDRTGADVRGGDNDDGDDADDDDSGRRRGGERD